MYRRFLSILLCLCLVLTLLSGAAVRAAEGEALDFEALEHTPGALGLRPSGAEEADPKPDEDTPVKVIIVLEESSVLQTDSRAVYNSATRKQMESLKRKQTQVLEKILDKLPETRVQVAYRYTWLLNGIAATVPWGAIEKIERMEGVGKVLLQQVYSPCEAVRENAGEPQGGAADSGREAVWALGYTGRGMKIAVIDTGLDSDHPSFQPLDEAQLTADSATPDTLEAVMEGLNARSRMPELQAEALYRSSKVPFGFNYCDDNTVIDHLDNKGAHGTHVAGIAAGNRVSNSRAVGIAPDAQLYIMKVFGVNGGAYTQDILAALEDALLLGADVINLSLGTPAGFTCGDVTAQGDSLDVYFDRIAATGTVLSVSAGNYKNSGYRNLWGTNANLTLYPDDGVVGSPGSYANTMTVASMENQMVQRPYIDAKGLLLSYTDASGYGLPALNTLKQTYRVVAVPGAGLPEDYTGLDAAGAVALVQRGSASFLQKHQAAEAAGAVALLVYNNAQGEFAMDMSGTVCATPAAAISREDGQRLLEALEDNPLLMLVFPGDTAPFPSPQAFTISEFSSRGPGPDLTLMPDLTASGGNIYSAVDGGGYGLMSGTSMAAPGAAGMAALVLQYVRENYAGETDSRALAQNLLMSTASPLLYSREQQLPYSPRSQGAGAANAFRAVTARGYLSVEGAELPKADLGDDPLRTGEYAYSFRVHNMGLTANYYCVDTRIQTEDFREVDGRYFLAGNPRALDAQAAARSSALVLLHDTDDSGSFDSRDALRIWQTARGEIPEQWRNESFRCDLSGDGAVSPEDVQQMLEVLVGNVPEETVSETVLKVAPGQSAAVEITLNLTGGDREYLDTYFPNGGYVEGYTTLTALHPGGVDLSLPYLAFYGDWAEAPVLDNAGYWDALNAPEGSVVGNQGIHEIYSQLGGRNKGIRPGENPYLAGLPFDKNNIVLSPNGDGNLDSVSEICLSLLRSAARVEIRFLDARTGECLFEDRADNVSRSVFQAAAGKIIPYTYSDYAAGELYDFAGLTDGAEIVLEATVLGVDASDTPERWTVPITIDLRGPELIRALRIQRDGSEILELTFRENHSAAAVILADGGGNQVYAVENPGQPTLEQDGKYYTVSLDITGMTGKLRIILADYAGNESAYGLNLGGEGERYGALVAYQNNFLTGTGSWVSFDTGVSQNEITLFPNSGADFAGAAYGAGFVWFQRSDGKLHRFPAEELLMNLPEPQTEELAVLERVYQSLTYHDADQTIYGLYRTEEETRIYAIRLAYVKNSDGTVTEQWQEEPVLQNAGIRGIALAAGGADSLLVLGTALGSREAMLWQILPEEKTGRFHPMLIWEKLGSLDISIEYPQSITWDTGSGKLLWAKFVLEAGKPLCQLVEISPGEYTILDKGRKILTTRVLGSLSGQTLGLMQPEYSGQEPLT